MLFQNTIEKRKLNPTFKTILKSWLDKNFGINTYGYEIYQSQNKVLIGSKGYFGDYNLTLSLLMKADE